MSRQNLAAVVVILLPLLAIGTFRNVPQRHAGQAFTQSIDRPRSARRGFAEAPPIRAWERVAELPEEIAVFETVFWEPQDTTHLRRWIGTLDLRGKEVLEVGTGSGLVALCCLQAGAEQVVATDVNPAALANAQFNAQRMGWHHRLQTRLVSPRQPEAYSIIAHDERFDVVISNPPWENAAPKSVEEAALYDPGFVLLNSLLRDSSRHLKPGGRLVLAYGCVDAIRYLYDAAPQYGGRVRTDDPRNLQTLPPVFLPGMVLEVEF